MEAPKPRRRASGQKRDSLEFKLLRAKRFHQQVKKFKDTDTCKHVRQILKERGIGEPYASNILERLFISAYDIINND